MNKIKQILIGAGILALSGNAAAMFIQVGGTEYTNWKSLLPALQQIVEEPTLVSLSPKKQAKLTAKLEKYNARLEAGENTRGVKKNIKRKVKKWNIAGLPSSVSNLDEITQGGGSDGGTGIPEPSTIALLGLGLVGIGAARRLRKKAR